MKFENHYLDEDINGYESVYDMWLDQKVTHVTPVTRERNRVKIKSLTPEEREKYLYLLDKLKTKYGRDGEDIGTDQGELSTGTKRVRINDPLGDLKEPPKFISTMYYSGNRGDLEYNEFEKGKLVVTTNDSSLSLDIQEKGSIVCVAYNVPVSSIKAYRDNKTGEWIEYPEMSQQQKYDKINFAKNTLFLADFYKFKMYIKFEQSDKDVTDDKLKDGVVEERNDIEATMKAKKLADEVIKFIRKWKDNLNEILIPTENGSFLILPVKAIDKDYPNLFVAFGRKRTHKAEYETYNDMQIIKIYCLEDELPVKFNYREMLKDGFDGIRSDLVHEFVHFFDLKKYDLIDVVSKIKKDKNNYFDLPHEYNAMYHEGIALAIDNLRQSDTLRNIFLNDFNKFRNYMWNQVFAQDFIHYMNKDTRRKVEKRLYSVWQELKEYFNKKKKKV